jgi:ATPase family AAA domain-containing protein 2
MSERSVHDEPEPEPEQYETPPVEYTSSRGRKTKKVVYDESDEDAEGSLDPDIDVGSGDIPPADGLFADGVEVKRNVRPQTRRQRIASDEEMERERRNPNPRGNLGGFIASDDDQPDVSGGFGIKRRLRRQQPERKKPEPSRRSGRTTGRRSSQKPSQVESRADRANRRNARRESDGNYNPSGASSITSNDEIQDDVHESDLEPVDMDGDADGEGEDELQEPSGYSLRQRRDVNYAIPPPLEEMFKNTDKQKSKSRPNTKKKGVPGWSATGADYDRWLGRTPAGGHDSDSDDYPRRTPGKPYGSGGMGALAGGAGGGGFMPTDLAAAAGTPANFGKVGDAGEYFEEAPMI